ncbi:MAG: hypothetical protein U1F45_18780 [Burkholderiales bacterium]
MISWVSAKFGLVLVLAAIPFLHAAAESSPVAAAKGIAFVYDSHGDIQDYRLDVDGDGFVRYFGRYRVKTEGIVTFSVPRERVLKLVEGLRLMKAFDYRPQRGFFIDGGGSHLSTTVALYVAGESNSLVYQAAANEDFHRKLSALVEELIPTESLRCPFDMTGNPRFPSGDICRLFRDDRRSR